MKKLRIPGVLVTIFLLGLAASSQLTGEAHAGALERKLVAGTGHIADIMRDLLDGKTDISIVIPPASCPGHQDIKARDVIFASKADAVILHAWQREISAIDGSLKALGMKKAPLAMQVAGSWLVPENQIKASREVAAALSSVYPDLAAEIDSRLQARLLRVENAADECRAMLAPYSGVPALSAKMQSEFVRWTGMELVASFDRTEEMTPADMLRLIRMSRDAPMPVQVVVDNLQSGPEAGLPLALELKAAHIVFSNFPLSSGETETYTDLLRHNCRLLAKALAERQGLARNDQGGVAEMSIAGN